VREGIQRLTESEELPGPGASGRDPRRQPLEVADLAQPSPQRAPHVTSVEQLSHCIQTILDRRAIEQWAKEPPSEQSSAHRGSRAVEQLEQGHAGAGSQRLHKFEISAGHLIEVHGAPAALDPGVAKVLHARWPHLLQIGEQRADRRQRGGVCFRVQPESLHAPHAEPIAQSLRPQLGVELPIGPPCHEPLPVHGVRVLRQQKLGRFEPGKVVSERARIA
jgi:hypothetical protein